MSRLFLVMAYLQCSTKQKGNGSGKIRMSKSATVSPEINLIGKTVDEAIPEL